MRLEGKTAVITGGGTGIGAACAWALGGEGCRVMVMGRRAEPLQETAGQFTGEPAIECQTIDVGDRESVQAAFDHAKQTLGQIDILIQSAGINVPNRSMEQLSPEDWDKLININATGAFNCMYQALPGMRDRQSGLIINISSIAGKRASVLGGVGYSAAKFAMTALGMTAGVEERKNSIRVTNIYPGEVETPILDNRPVPVSAEHRARILQPEDVADAVLMVTCLPPRAHIPEMIVKPTSQEYV